MHLSDVDAREAFRHVSVLEAVRIGKVAGKGVDGYREGAGDAQGGVGVSRADRVAGRLEDVDALLVTEPANLRYVTGFTGSNGFALVGRDVRRFVTDFRYVEQAKLEVPDFDREQGPQELFAALKGFSGRLGFDDAHLSVKAAPAAGRAAGRTSSWCRCAGVVEDVRAVKEPGEILRIAAAAALVDEIYGWLLEFGIVGPHRALRSPSRWSTRCACAARPGRRFRRSSPSAEHGALPHAQPREVEIPRDTLVTIDIGAVLDGYCSDCTRTWATGDLPDELAEAYALVLRAQVTALDAVRPGPLGARDRRDRARHHHRRGPRRPLRPRARARRRARHPRGAAARALGRTPRWWPGTS